MKFVILFTNRKTFLLIVVFDNFVNKSTTEYLKFLKITLSFRYLIYRELWAKKSRGKRVKTQDTLNMLHKCTYKFFTLLT